MSTENLIRILEKTPNKKGDLFGKLMEGLFIALGYDRIRLNIHKSGREVDVEGAHRTEHRRVIAECKATDKPIGGDDVNKFVGSLDAEKRKDTSIQTEGYFISLAGFTETAIEQELELGNKRVTLLTGNKVLEQLIKGRIIVPQPRAMELAGRCASAVATDVIPDDRCTLLAHEVGWLWLIYFSRNMEKTHFALVHADGQLIGQEITSKIVSSDRATGGDLHRLQYLTPTREELPSEVEVGAARRAYENYLAEQCGEIQLEGLPADEEIGARRLKLENIFVPLFVRAVAEDADGASVAPKPNAEAEAPVEATNPATPAQGRENKPRLPVGSVLAKNPRLAILGPPGGGKSTLLKRLAVAYTSPSRRELIRDHLPKRSWLPLLVRCRQLDKLARRPISEILDDIAARAELSPDMQLPFTALVQRSLRSGEALLLVDGLDEIPDEGDRLAFVNQLRIFLTTYPNVGLIVTSREAGFRVIGGGLSTHCARFELAEFDSDDITNLTQSWHTLVVGDSAKVRKDAVKLATTICADTRVRQLAQNPLLLTTLLLVQRWVGQLPTKRSVLYAKAIEVLLMTWNVEAHQPLDLEEALPQLEFLAMHMMQKRAQRISFRELTEVLSSARKQMPEVLAFARMSVGDFIRRVELRSSLLMVTGHQIDQGALYPVYEFRHLTFQEYLAARAAAYGHFPGRRDTDNVATILNPYLNDPNWKEVIPLAAVLSGRDCRPLISDLIAAMAHNHPQITGSESATYGERSIPLPRLLLATCLSDEVQLQPDLLHTAMPSIVENCPDRELLMRLAESKYGTVFEESARAAFEKGYNLLALGGYFCMLAEREWGFEATNPIATSTKDKIQGLLAAPDPWSVAIACLGIMHIAFSRSTSYLVNPRTGTRVRSTRLARLHSADMETLEMWREEVRLLTKSDTEIIQFAAAWAFVWLVQATNWNPAPTPSVIADLLATWRAATQKEWGYIPAWTLTSFPLLPRKARPITNTSPELVQFIEAQASAAGVYERWAALLIAYYIQAPWSDKDLAERVSQKRDSSWTTKCQEELIKALAHNGA